MYSKTLLERSGVRAVLDKTEEFVSITEGVTLPVEKQRVVAVTVDTLYEIVRCVGPDLRNRKERVNY